MNLSFRNLIKHSLSPSPNQEIFHPCTDLRTEIEPANNYKFNSKGKVKKKH